MSEQSPQLNSKFEQLAEKTGMLTESIVNLTSSFKMFHALITKIDAGLSVPGDYYNNSHFNQHASGESEGDQELGSEEEDQQIEQEEDYQTDQDNSNSLDQEQEYEEDASDGSYQSYDSDEEGFDVEKVGYEIYENQNPNNIRSVICGICLDQMTDGALIKLQCLHVLHKECLRPWVEETPKCPTCKTVLKQNQ